MPESLQQAAGSINFTAILDILIISSLIYLLLLWLRERASRSLAIVSLGLTLIFFVASWLDLYLTTMAFRYGSIGILFAFVVIFQSDIRYGFERLASTNWFKKPLTNNLSKHRIDTILEAVNSLALEKIGALIVFPGREPLDLHLRGGVSVNADLSVPLLLSIFHPHSPGHDGAILIDEGRISHLGLHLPLTTDVERVRNKGTRHSAALGLAQRSDALILVVSEVRGTVSIAKDGNLTTVEPAEVNAHIEAFVEQATGRRAKQSQPQCIRRILSFHSANLTTKALSLLIASTLWFAFANKTDILQRTFVVPIEYRNLPEHLAIKEPQLSFAEVTMAGQEASFSLLDPTAISVSLDVSATQAGDRQQWIAEDHLSNVPNDLSVKRINPVIISAQFTVRNTPET